MWIVCFGALPVAQCIFLTFLTFSVFSRDRARGDADDVRQNEIALKPYEITIFYVADQCPLPPSPSKRWGGSVHRGVLLTGAPSRCSLEAETCTAPHKCGWSEPRLFSASSKKKKMVRWKRKKGWRFGFPSPRKMVKWQGGNADTDLKADPVFWIRLLTFRRSEHWRHHRINTRTGKRGEAKKKAKKKTLREEEQCW